MHTGSLRLIEVINSSHSVCKLVLFFFPKSNSINTSNMHIKNIKVTENYKSNRAIIIIVITTKIYKNTFIYEYNMDNFITSFQKLNTS